MDASILRDALKKRRGRKFDADGFLNEEAEGLDSDELRGKTTAVLGEGASESDIKKVKSGDSGSSDDLAPSKKELSMQGVEGAKMPKPFENAQKDDYGQVGRSGEDVQAVSDVGGNVDEAVFDEREFKKAKNKRKMSLTERMQFSLGNKLRK
jgi:hypothetical protein